MNRHACILIVLWCALSSCTSEEVPDPVPPPSSSTAPPEPPSTTVPPDVRQPSDYIRVVRAPSILEYPNGLIPATQELSNRGWRAVEKVLRECPWAFPDYFPMTRKEATKFAERSMELTHLSENRFIPNLRKINERCSGDDEDPWCKVTEVRKDFYEPFGALGDPDTPRGEFWRQLDQTRDLQNRAQLCAHRIRAANGKSYDSIAGWCTAVNELGWRADDCL